MIELESDLAHIEPSHSSCIDGKWVVNLTDTRSGIQRHRTLASGLEAIPGPCAVGTGTVDLTQMRQRELSFPNRRSTRR